MSMHSVVKQEGYGTETLADAGCMKEAAVIIDNFAGLYPATGSQSQSSLSYPKGTDVQHVVLPNKSMVDSRDKSHPDLCPTTGLTQ